MPAIDWGNSLTSGLKFCFDGSEVEQIGSQALSPLDAEVQLGTAADGKAELVLSGSQVAGQPSYPLGAYETGIAGIGKLTLDVLVRFDDLATDWAVFGKWGATTDHWNYQISNIANGIRFGVGNVTLSGSAHIVTTNDQTTLLTAGQYHHIICTYTNGVGVGEPGRTELRVYVDCAEQPRTVVSNVAVASLGSDTFNRLMLGNNEYGTQPLPGRIKLARIWARKLSTTELSQLCADPYRIFATAKKQEAGRATPDGCSEDDPNCRTRPARDRKGRRKVIINDRAYWATDSELPGLLKALLTQAPKPQRKAKAQPKPKPAPKARELREIVPAVELAPLPDLAARYRAMLVQFQAKQDEQAIHALRLAYAKAIEDDEHDVETLILGL